MPLGSGWVEVGVVFEEGVAGLVPEFCSAEFDCGEGLCGDVAGGESGVLPC